MAKFQIYFFQQVLQANNNLHTFHALPCVQHLWGLGQGEEAAKVPSPGNMLEVTPKGLWDLPRIQAKEPSLCLSLQLTSGLMLKKVDS